MIRLAVVEMSSGATIGGVEVLDEGLVFFDGATWDLFRSARTANGWDDDRTFDALAAGWTVDGFAAELDEVLLNELARAEGPDEDDEILRAMDRYKLRRYWTQDPRGLAKWAEKPHPWTSLYRHLRKFLGSARAKRAASQWFKAVFKIWPGERKGTNPVGPG